MFVQSKHKELVGHVDGDPYHVLFDEDGFAEVDDAVGEQLLQLGAAVQVQEPDASTDLSKLNPAQLKRYAKDNGIDIGEATKKVDLLQIIQAHEPGKSNQAPEGSPSSEDNQTGNGSKEEDTSNPSNQGGDN